jgi:hypothetical protein
MAEHIQIGDVSPRIQYVADGVQAAYTYPFPVFAAADLEVYLGSALQAGGFTVSGAGTSGGGTVIFAPPPANGVLVTLRRRVAIKRTTDHQADGVIRAKTLNDEFDYQTAAIQQVAEDSGRAVRRAVTSPSTADLTLPEPLAGRALKWNADGTALENSAADADTVLAAATAAAAAAASARAGADADAAATSADRAAVAADRTAAAGSAVAAAVSASDAAASATAAIVAKITWRGSWSAAATYAAHDAVTLAGSSYVCTQAHANRPPPDGAVWEVLAARGSDGSGSGDMVAANNLSELTSPAVARAHLGLAAVAANGAYADLSGKPTLGAAAALDVDADATMAANSDLKLPTQKAVVAHVAAQIAAGGGPDPYPDIGQLYLALARLDTPTSPNVGGTQVADEFDDGTGIGSLGGATLAGGYLSNPGGWTADLLAGATATASSVVNGSYPPADAFNGNDGTFWHSGAGSPQWLQAQLAAPARLTRITVYDRPGQPGQAPRDFALQASATGAFAGEQVTLLTVAGCTSWPGPKSWDFANATAYGYYRLVVTADNGGDYTALDSLQGFGALAPADVTVVSTAYAAATAPANLSLVAEYQDMSAAAVVGTDITFEASRNGGTTWTQVAMTDFGPSPTGGRVLKGTTSVAAQPGGTAMKWRLTTLNAKEQRIHGIWMQWR